jgi:hypothetical protein
MTQTAKNPPGYSAECAALFRPTLAAFRTHDGRGHAFSCLQMNKWLPAYFPVLLVLLNIFQKRH